MVNPFTDAANVRADNYFSQTCRFNDRNRHCFVATAGAVMLFRERAEDRYRAQRLRYRQLCGVMTNLFEE